MKRFLIRVIVCKDLYLLVLILIYVLPVEAALALAEALLLRHLHAGCHRCQWLQRRPAAPSQWASGPVRCRLAPWKSAEQASLQPDDP